MSTPQWEAARDLYPLIDRNAADTTGTSIAAKTVEAIQRADLYGVMTPRELGGAELSIPDAIDVFAELSRADGSVGWCVMAGAILVSYFGAYGDQSLIDEMFGSGIPIGAGQFAPNGTGTSSASRPHRASITK